VDRLRDMKVNVARLKPLQVLRVGSSRAASIVASPELLKGGEDGSSPILEGYRYYHCGDCLYCAKL